MASVPMGGRLAQAGAGREKLLIAKGDSLREREVICRLSEMTLCDR